MWNFIKDFKFLVSVIKTSSFLNKDNMLLLLTTYVQLVPEMRFYRNSYKVLKSKSADMNVLVAMGTTSAWVNSKKGSISI